MDTRYILECILAYFSNVSEPFPKVESGFKNSVEGKSDEINIYPNPTNETLAIDLKILDVSSN